MPAQPHILFEHRENGFSANPRDTQGLLGQARLRFGAKPDCGVETSLVPNVLRSAPMPKPVALDTFAIDALLKPLADKTSITLRRTTGRSRLSPPCRGRVSVLFAMTASAQSTQHQ
jgi:hypothetical protein